LSGVTNFFPFSLAFNGLNFPVIRRFSFRHSPESNNSIGVLSCLSSLTNKKGKLYYGPKITRTMACANKVKWQFRFH
jgi:hypothetical protein